MKDVKTKYAIGAVFFVIALFFVHRSFYGMRIQSQARVSAR